MKFCSPQKFEENSTNFPVGYCFSQHEFSGGSSCLPIIWHDFLCENSFYSNFPWKFLMKILSVRYVCCRVPVEDELHVSQSKTRTCVIKTLGLIMSRVSDNILKPFLTNLPCLCQRKLISLRLLILTMTRHLLNSQLPRITFDVRALVLSGKNVARRNSSR